MNEPRVVNPRRLIVLSIFMLVVLLALLFWAREVIRELFVLPLSYLWWAISTIAMVVPQIYQWLVVVALALLIAFRALAPRAKKVAPTPPVLAELDYDMTASRGRLAFWSTKVDLLRTGSSPYYQSTFHNALGRLLVELLAHRYHLSPPDVEKRLRAEPGSEAAEPLGSSLPPDIRAYALFSLQRGELSPTSGLNLLLRRLREQLRDWFGGWSLFKNRSASSESAKAPLDSRVARVIQYMEEELEVSNDHSSY